MVLEYNRLYRSFIDSSMFKEFLEKNRVNYEVAKDINDFFHETTIENKNDKDMENMEIT